MAQDNNYVVGRGKLYFDRFADGTKQGTGEMYFGNTPELSVSQDTTALDHYNSDEGLKIKDASVDLQNDMKGSFSTDNISPANLALWFLGDAETVTQTAQTGATETVKVKLGRFVQLGKSTANPSGVRMVTNVTAKKGAATVTLAGNIDVDLNNARLYFEPDATDISDGDDVEITYDITAGTRERVIGKGQTIYGSLRFISANPVGGQKNHFYPYVKLTSNGDYALKGDEWQVMSFNIEVLKLDDATQRVYIDVIKAS